MRRNIFRIFIACVSCTDDRLACELPHGNMIRMPIIPIRRKGNHDLRLYPSNVGYYFPNGLVVIRLVHLAIDVIEKGDFLHAKFMDSLRQFLFTKFAERAQARIPLLGTEPASLPA